MDPILGRVGSVCSQPWVISKRDQSKGKGSQKRHIRFVERTVDEDVLREDDDLTLALLSAVSWRQWIAAVRVFPFDGSVPLMNHELGPLLPADLEPPRFSILLGLKVLGSA